MTLEDIFKKEKEKKEEEKGKGNKFIWIVSLVPIVVELEVNLA